MSDTFVVEKVHPQYKKANGFRPLTRALVSWMTSWTRLRDGLQTYDVTKDWKDGLVLVVLLEEITGEVHESMEGGMGNHSKMDALRDALKWVSTLGVRSVGDATWTADQIYGGEPLACWGLAVAIALRFGCPTELPPNVFLAHSVDTYLAEGYEEGVSLPISQKATKKMLTPSEQGIQDERAYYLEKYGVVLKQKTLDKRRLSFSGGTKATEQQQMRSWVHVVARGWEVDADLSWTFKTGVKLVWLLENLTGKRAIEVLHDRARKFKEDATTKKDCLQNIKIAFTFMEELNIPARHMSNAEAVQYGEAAQVLELVKALRQHFPDAEHEAFVEELKMFDKDGDGVINGDELREVFIHFLDAPVSDAQFEFARKKLDADGDGEISVAELGAIRSVISFLEEAEQEAEAFAETTIALKKVHAKQGPKALGPVEEANTEVAQQTRLKALFDQYDVDGDSTLGASDWDALLKQLSQHPDLRDDIIKRVDTSGSNSVDFAEFLALADLVKEGEFPCLSYPMFGEVGLVEVDKGMVPVPHESWAHVPDLGAPPTGGESVLLTIRTCDGASKKVKAPKDVTGYGLLAIAAEKMEMCPRAAKLFELCLSTPTHDRWLVMALPLLAQVEGTVEFTMKRRVLKRLVDGDVHVLGDDKAIWLTAAQNRENLLKEPAGHLCAPSSAFRLASLSVQAEYGDFRAYRESTFLDTVGLDRFVRKHIVQYESSRKLRSRLAASARATSRIFHGQKALRGMTAMEAYFEYHRIFQSLPTFGCTIFATKRTVEEADAEPLMFAIHESAVLMWSSPEGVGSMAFPQIHKVAYEHIKDVASAGDALLKINTTGGMWELAFTCGGGRDDATALLMDYALLYFAQRQLKCSFNIKRRSKNALPVPLYAAEPDPVPAVDSANSRLDLLHKTVMTTITTKYQVQNMSTNHVECIKKLNPVLEQLTDTNDRAGRVLTELTIPDTLCGDLEALKILLDSLGQCCVYHPSGRLEENLKIERVVFEGGDSVVTKDTFSALEAVRWPWLTSISLERCSLNDDVISSICALLYTCPGLATLQLAHNALSGDGVQQLMANLLETKRALASLDVSFNAIQDSGIAGIAAYAESEGGGRHSLVHVDVSHCGMTTKSIGMLMEKISGCSHLNSLGLGGIADTKAVDIAMTGMKICNVNELLLTSTNLSKSPDALAALLTANRFTHLRLADSHLGKKGAFAVASALHHQITLLDIRDCAFDEKAYALVFRLAGKGGLVSLRAGGTPVGKSTIVLAEGLASERCKLKELTLTRCKLAGSTFAPVLEAMRRRCTVTELDVSGNPKAHEAHKALVACVSADDAVLISLNLRETGLGAEDPSVLTDIIHASHSLDALDVSNNKMNVKYMKKFAELVEPSHVTLTKFDMRENPGGKDATAAGVLVDKLSGCIVRTKLVVRRVVD